ncbi:hypothetical protein SARC_18168, partial [Sphaeroforma arctica JP610]
EAAQILLSHLVLMTIDCCYLMDSECTPDRAAQSLPLQRDNSSISASSFPNCTTTSTTPTRTTSPVHNGIDTCK